MRSIFIYSEMDFPRAGAASNYLQYLALACENAGYKVKLLVRQKNVCYSYFFNLPAVLENRIEIISLPQKNRKLFFIKREIEYLSKLSAFFKELKITSEDVLITYVNVLSYLNEAKKTVRMSKCKWITCPVEHFGFKDFESPNRLLKFIMNRIYFNLYLPKSDLAFAISRAIRDSVNQMGGNAVTVPIMADTNEIDYKEKTLSDKFRIIFPANGMMKDSLDNMIYGLAYLPYEILSKIEFHICGVKKEIVQKMMRSVNNQQIKEVIVIHDWMEYDSLLQLYESMHYLLISRKDTLMTRSNFPSKIPETLCHGIVPIASRVGDYTELYLEDGINAIVFNGDSGQDCANAIMRAVQLNQNEYLEMSKKARECAEKKFDYRVWSEFICTNVEKLFRQ